MKKLTKTLCDIGGNPVPVLGKVVYAVIMISFCLVWGVAAYLYAVIYCFGEKLRIIKRGEPVTGIRETADACMKKHQPSLPHPTSIEFGLFLVALMLSIYSLYILVRYLIFSII